MNVEIISTKRKKRANCMHGHRRVKRRAVTIIGRMIAQSYGNTHVTVTVLKVIQLRTIHTLYFDFIL